MEQGVDAMAAVRLDDAEVLGLGVLFDDVAEILDGNAWLYVGDCLVEAFAGGFDKADIVGVTAGFVPDVVSLVEIAVVAFVE